MIRTILVTTIGLLSAAFAAANLPADERPNVVLILSDDQGWGDYGFMGHDTIQTPHLDKLAAESLVFRRGYLDSAICRPSLASILTGLHSHQHGVTGNDVGGTKNRAALDKPVQARLHEHPSVIKSLVEAGYLAHQSGKWWEGSFIDGGFTHGMTHGDPTRGGRHGDAGLTIGRNGLEPVTTFIDHAIDAHKPFFVWYAPFLPHTPHNPPQRLLDKYAKEGRPADVARYYAMCEWFDETCGELLAHLDERKVRENTIVVFICDNGWTPCSANIDDPNQKQWDGFALRSKGSPFEGGIRTPIMFRWPAKIKPAEAASLAQSIDLFPTIAAACGAKPPEGLPGVNLLDAEARSKRDTIFGSTHAIHNMTPGDPDDTLQYQWCISGDWKLLVRHDGKDTTKYKNVHSWDREPLRLYNLADDPHEKSNLADARPEVVEALKQKLEGWHHPDRS